MARLEDIYLPFRPKRKTRATAAKERGLEPLAKRIFAQDHGRLDPEKEALAFVDVEKGVASAHEALAGARDIMAEWMSEDAEARRRMRSLYQSQGVLRSIAVAGKEKYLTGQRRSERLRQIQGLSGLVRAHRSGKPAQAPGHAAGSASRGPEPARGPG